MGLFTALGYVHAQVQPQWCGLPIAASTYEADYMTCIRPCKKLLQKLNFLSQS